MMQEVMLMIYGMILVLDIWYDTRSDIYDFQYDLRSEVYDHDDKRAQKKMDKFKKSILRMKEDVND